MASARGRIDKLIKEYTVFVVSKSSCPFCHTAKKVLHDYDIPPEKYKVIEIEGDKECSAIQDYMHQLTGARTVPRVFINGNCIGGGNETSMLHRSGELKRMLREAGAIV